MRVDLRFFGLQSDMDASQARLGDYSRLAALSETRESLWHVSFNIGAGIAFVALRLPR